MSVTELDLFYFKLMTHCTSSSSADGVCSCDKRWWYMEMWIFSLIFLLPSTVSNCVTKINYIYTQYIYQLVQLSAPRSDLLRLQRVLRTATAGSQNMNLLNSLHISFVTISHSPIKAKKTGNKSEKQNISRKDFRSGANAIPPFFCQYQNNTSFYPLLWVL